MLVVVTNIPTPYRTAFFNEMVVQLKAMGIGFHVVFCAKTEPRRFFTFDQSEVLYEHTFLKGFHLNFKNLYLHFNFGLAKKLNELKPTSVIMAGSWNMPTLVDYMLFNRNQSCAYYFWSEGHQDAQRSSSRVVGYLRKFILKRFDGFLVPNFNSKQYVLDILKLQTILAHFLPNTVDETFFNKKKAQDANHLFDELGIAQTDRIIILISTLSYRKGVEEFLKAYQSIDSLKREKLHLLFLGEGELKFKLKKIKKNHSLLNVHFLGHVDKELVRDILNQSHCFALPTRLDPNPLTPIEASFMKLPLMLSNKAGNFKELKLDKTGFPISSITKEHIKNQIEAFIETSQDDLNLMGEEAYRNVQENFSRKKVAENLITFLISERAVK